MVVLLLLLAAGQAQAAGCREAISAAEATEAIPSGLLAAIGHVESGRADPATGLVSPWPWAVDINGEGHFFPDEQQALGAVRAAQARGVRSIDVGCLQINLLQHPRAFASLDQAFDPVANADYGARFLRQLHDQTGSWPEAAADYHSQTPALGIAYARLVMNAWPGEQRQAVETSPAIGDLPAAMVNPTPFALPFRFEAGPIRMGAAAPPMGRSIAAASVAPMISAGTSSDHVGRDLSFYRRDPIRPRQHGPLQLKDNVTI